MQTLATRATSNKLCDLKNFRKETTIPVVNLQCIYVNKLMKCRWTSVIKEKVGCTQHSVVLRSISQ